MKEDSAPTSLDERLAKLPSDIVPPRNLWPGIVREILRRPRASPALAFAAAAAVICFAGALAWVVLHSRSEPGAAGAATAHVGASLAEPRDAGYLATRAELEKIFRERLELLDPTTRAKIETSLASIRAAREDITKALAADPESPVLEQLLESAWHDEFDLYDDVVRTTEPTLARI
jgi:hypothetical protein